MATATAANQETKAPSSKVMPCTCKHEFQDREYGKGMRVHNHAPKKKHYACTVCGARKLD